MSLHIRMQDCVGCKKAYLVITSKGVSSLRRVAVLSLMNTERCAVEQGRISLDSVSVGQNLSNGKDIVVNARLLSVTRRIGNTTEIERL